MTSEKKTGTLALKTGLAEMLKGGVIMDVTNEDQAKIAEDAGAVAVMALERVPADIRREGGVARMADPAVVERIMAVVTIPVMAKCRIGHFAEARVLESLGVDFIDESEVLTPADEAHHVDKHAFKVPFVCGCRDLGEALRRIGEGAALLRTKGEAGTGNIVEAVRHMRTVVSGIKRLTTLLPEELMAEAKNLGAPYELVRLVAADGPAARAELRRGRHRHPRRRRLDDGPGGGVGVRGVGHLQVGRPCAPRPRHRAGHHALAGRQGRGRGLARAGRGHAGAGDRRHAGSREAPDPGVVMRPFGVLALQGDFAAHSKALRELDVPVREVRRVAELRGLAGLVIPGGESTTLLNLMHDEPWFESLRRFHEDGGVLLGTCAGAILLAREVRPRQKSLELLDAVVERNAYGRQVDSFEARVDAPALGGPVDGVFIRAPRFVALWPEVEVLGRHEGEPVLVREGRVIAATFHPELTRSRALHRYAVDLAGSARGLRAVKGRRTA